MTKSHLVFLRLCDNLDDNKRDLATVNYYHAIYINYRDNNNRNSIATSMRHDAG